MQLNYWVRALLSQQVYGSPRSKKGRGGLKRLRPGPGLRVESLEERLVPATPTYQSVTGATNPFSNSNIGMYASYTHPELADLDSDGDHDLIMGLYDGSLEYFRNTGSATNPQYVRQTGSANPFNNLYWGDDFAHPEAGDVDGDGDLDVIKGGNVGLLHFYRNVGTATNPAYVSEIQNHPFYGILVHFDSAPALADLDGDGDLDLTIGSLDSVRYWRNTGSAISPVYVEQTVAANPFNGINRGIRAYPALGDVDGDGDYDLILGSKDGRLGYWRNVGSASAPSYVEQTGSSNPFAQWGVGEESTPVLGATDGDGDLDMVVGDGNSLSDFLYLRATVGVFTPYYTPQPGFDNPLSQVNTGAYAAPALTDLDGDGDRDAVVGAFDGTLRYYVNVGTLTTPIYVTAFTNPFNSIDVGVRATPASTDVDGDGDLDFVAGNSNGELRFFRNTGNLRQAVFVEQWGSANPFNGVFTSGNTAPSLTDVDGDGDTDLVLGSADGTLGYWRNTGTATSPVYIQQTGGANPFSAIDVGDWSKPALADFDRDGDPDLIVSEFYGSVRFFRNEGVVTIPVYVEKTGLANPFGDIAGLIAAAPVLADLDGDGDDDLAVGDAGGTVGYYRAAFDEVAPTASLAAKNLRRPRGTSYTFTVTYSDDIAVRVATLDNQDVRVIGPNGFNQYATFVSVDVTSDGTPRTATYRITAPGGVWDPTDNGTYTVSLHAGQVTDLGGNGVPAGSLGNFIVVVTIIQPTADWVPPPIVPLPPAPGIIQEAHSDVAPAVAPTRSGGGEDVAKGKSLARERRLPVVAAGRDQGDTGTQETDALLEILSQAAS